MNNFFILGMPRSRTLWFSKLFNKAGIPCAHEYFSSHNEIKFMPGVKGYSDTNPLMAPDYGDSPVLIIERNIDDVISSIYNAFDKPDGVNNWGECIGNYMLEYRKALDKIRPKNCMKVAYCDINDKLAEIWRFLVPDVECEADYLLQYREKIIKTDNRDIQGSLEHTFGSMKSFAEKYDLDLMDAYRITDYAVAQHIINECWDEISEDGIDQYMPDIVNEYWIGLHNGEETVGCYRLHQLTSICWEGHVFMRPKHRKEYSKLGCFTTLQWIIDNTDCEKLIANVPMKFENVMKFLEGIGFVTEGVNRKSFTKDGKLWDVVHYGLTRPEIEGLL